MLGSKEISVNYKVILIQYDVARVAVVMSTSVPICNSRCLPMLLISLIPRPKHRLLPLLIFPYAKNTKLLGRRDGVGTNFGNNSISS